MRVSNEVVQHESRHAIAAVVAALDLLPTKAQRARIAEVQLRGKRSGHTAEIILQWPQNSLSNLIADKWQTDFLGAILLAPALCDLDNDADMFLRYADYGYLGKAVYAHDIEQAKAFEPSPAFCVQTAKKVWDIERGLNKHERQMLMFGVERVLSGAKTHPLLSVLPLPRIVEILSAPNKALLQARGLI